MACAQSSYFPALQDLSNRHLSWSQWCLQRVWVLTPGGGRRSTTSLQAFGCTPLLPDSIRWYALPCTLVPGWHKVTSWQRWYSCMGLPQGCPSVAGGSGRWALESVISGESSEDLCSRPYQAKWQHSAAAEHRFSPLTQPLSPVLLLLRPELCCSADHNCFEVLWTGFWVSLFTVLLVLC